MTKIIIKKFIANNENIKDHGVRKKYGEVSGFVGIICNILLFAAKLVAGLITSSIAIMADAFNNLSDAGSSIVTIIGFKLADKPADKDHPFGHGRIEYLSGFVVALIILLVGFELIKTSIDKIVTPTPVEFKIVSLVIMILSIGVKLWMAVFNKYVGKKINSSAITAVAADSLNDVVATSGVIIGILISHYADINIDGYIGFFVAFFILKAGFDTCKDTLDPLLGQPPEPEFVEAIENEVLSYNEVVGIHDLIVHNYGPGRVIISLHAEVPSSCDIIEIHDVIDNIEKNINSKFNCETVIHMDPIMVDDEKINKIRDEIINIINNIDNQLSIHDFRLVEGPTHTNVIFDIVVPWDFHLKNSELYKKILDGIKLYNNSFNAVVNFDRSFN